MVKRKARHRYVYVVEFFNGPKKLGIAMKSFLGQEDARAHGKLILRGDKSGMSFMVHKLTLHSATHGSKTTATQSY